MSFIVVSLSGFYIGCGDIHPPTKGQFRTNPNRRLASDIGAPLHAIAHVLRRYVNGWFRRLKARLRH
jgi:hypothetical protein